MKILDSLDEGFRVAWDPTKADGMKTSFKANANLANILLQWVS